MGTGLNLANHESKYICDKPSQFCIFKFKSDYSTRVHTKKIKLKYFHETTKAIMTYEFPGKMILQVQFNRDIKSKNPLLELDLIQQPSNLSILAMALSSFKGFA